MPESSFPEEAPQWEDVALRARPRLVSAARRILRNREDAEDAADEAIAKLAAEVRAGIHFVEIEPWLYRATLHLAIDRARRWVMSRRKFLEIARRPRKPAADPGEEASRTEVRETVWRRILELPDRQQQVVILRDMEGLPFRDVARCLGIEESTARSQAYAAREELRRKLLRWKRVHGDDG